MPITKKRKEEVCSDLLRSLKDAVGVVFVSFSGLTVADASSLRRSLREKSSGYLVAKKSLVKRVLSSLDIAGDSPTFEGELAVAYGNDAVLPAKGIAEFIKKNQEKMKISGGVLEGKYISAAEVIALGALPGRQDLYAQLLSVLVGPMRGLVTVMNGVPKAFVVSLNEISKTKTQ